MFSICTEKEKEGRRLENRKPWERLLQKPGSKKYCPETIEQGKAQLGLRCETGNTTGWKVGVQKKEASMEIVANGRCVIEAKN